MHALALAGQTPQAWPATPHASSVCSPVVMQTPLAVQQPAQLEASQASGWQEPVSASQPVPSAHAEHASPPVPHALSELPGTHCVPFRQQPEQSEQSATGTHWPAAHVSLLPQASQAWPGVPHWASFVVLMQRSPSQHPEQVAALHVVPLGGTTPASDCVSPPDELQANRNVRASQANIFITRS
jgi:hypothetical protein